VPALQKEGKAEEMTVEQMASKIEAVDNNRMEMNRRLLDLEQE
jgi:hypothetical protein